MNLATFLTTISDGFPIQIIATTYTVGSIWIGETPLDVTTVTAVDLGKYFTANQILDSYALRSAIDAGNLTINAGVITPTVDQVG